jgi:hypothetical protein
MKTRSFRNALFAVFAGGLALVPVVASASGLTLTAGQGTLTGKVALTVPVTVTCASPFWDPASQQLVDELVEVSVEQASGREIAHGFGIFRAQTPDALPLQCDGSSVTVPVSILADTSGPPFHSGSAVVTVTADMDAGTSCGFPGCFFNIVTNSASIGPEQIKVR